MPQVFIIIHTISVRRVVLSMVLLVRHPMEQVPVKDPRIVQVGHGMVLDVRYPL